MHQILLEITMLRTYIKWTLPETELAADKSKVQKMCQHYSIHICSKQRPGLFEVFRRPKNARTVFGRRGKDLQYRYPTRSL